LAPWVPAFAGTTLSQALGYVVRLDDVLTRNGMA
jgi:hypothetical protein